MNKKIFFFLFFISCISSTSSVEIDTYNLLVYENIDNEIIQEDLSDKNTIIVFWADYWGICRQELPVLEENLKNLRDEYDVIALAHSDKENTTNWVKSNLKGDLKVGFSNEEIRDTYKVIGQPLTIILNKEGEIIYREYGYIPINDL